MTLILNICRLHCEPTEVCCNIETGLDGHNQDIVGVAAAAAAISRLFVGGQVKCVSHEPPNIHQILDIGLVNGVISGILPISAYQDLQILKCLIL